MATGKTSNPMKDIQTRCDIEWLVDRFYERVNENELLAPIFAHLDWSIHKPVMYNFWSSMMLGDGSYTGNPLDKHTHLSINAAHFTAWLELFNATVDQYFVGTNANEIKSRANTIAGIFQIKLKIVKK